MGTPKVTQLHPAQATAHADLSTMSRRELRQQGTYIMRAELNRRRAVNYSRAIAETYGGVA